MQSKNEIICTRCDSNSIGSTIEHLHIRIREHLMDKKSSVYKHLHQWYPTQPSTVQQDNRVKMISEDMDEAQLRLREGDDPVKPKANHQQQVELDQYKDFYSFDHFPIHAF